MSFFGRETGVQKGGPRLTDNGTVKDFAFYYTVDRASQVTLAVKNPPANAGDIRDTGSIPGSGRSPGEGHANPLQYSWLENPMARRAWRATVHTAAQSGAQLK